MKSEEFEPERQWWGSEEDSFISREESKYSWKVSLSDLKARNYNLDLKNPHIADQEIHDPEILLAKYEDLLGQITDLRSEMRSALSLALKKSH